MTLRPGYERPPVAAIINGQTAAPGTNPERKPVGLGREQLMDKRDLHAGPRDARGPLEPTRVGACNDPPRWACPRVQILNRGN